MPKPKRTSSVTPEQIIAARGDLTQEQAAQLIGISRRAWQNMECGNVAMSETTFVEFKRRTGIAPQTHIPQDVFDQVVTALVDTMDARHAHVKTITAGGPPAPFHLGYAVTADALQTALEAHGITITE